MSIIRILPEIISNKIAAGEVVERPASVVKELLENALDASSTRIFIDIENGGRRSIQVSDNGDGMSHDDALLALERFATSKILEDQDLYAIKTLGFRGEALPSIAAVSKFSLVTKQADTETGLEIVVSGGKISRVSEVGAPNGTMVTVRNLFFNTPARRKFLKTVNTEMSHIADTVARIALGAPEIQFRLTHNGRMVKQWHKASDPMERIADVLGFSNTSELYPVTYHSPNDITVSGAVGSPRVTRTSSKSVYFFVNGRYVRDRILMHALFDGYCQRLVKGQFPIAVIAVRIPPEKVDVNVHPTKHEVRFAEQNHIHEAVKAAISRTLDQMDRPTKSWHPEPEPPVDEWISETPEPFREIGPVPAGDDFPNSVPDCEPETIPQPLPSPSPVSRESQSPGKPSQVPLWESRGFGDLQIIGQFHGTYILCETEKELILVDQHAAHERIIFERLKQQRKEQRVPSQKLLIPETFELGFSDATLLEKLLPVLNDAGLEIEPFGGNTFVVKSVPTPLSGKAVSPLIHEILDNTPGIDASQGIEPALDRCIMLMACHSAIRANQRLSRDQMESLLKQLDACHNPSNCPHGRPTWIRWSVRFLEKSFQRIT